VRTQLLAWFIDNFIPEAEKTAYGCSARRRPISWLQVASALPESGDCLSTALAALSAARLGRLHHNRQLAMESKGLYVTALSRLQAALYDPHRMYRDEALASCMALELFEVGTNHFSMGAASGHKYSSLPRHSYVRSSIQYSDIKNGKCQVTRVPRG
jgi:hypothetical protein